MATQTVPVEVRKSLVQARGVTLDGRPAVISGWRNSFARVTQTATGLSAEWAWSTVERIVAKHGKFLT